MAGEHFESENEINNENSKYVKNFSDIKIITEEIKKGKTCHEPLLLCSKYFFCAFLLCIKNFSYSRVSAIKKKPKLVKY